LRHTKIIATIGPASESDATLDALIAAGTDIIRLNFSHGTHEWHRGMFARIRKAAERVGRDVAVLQDLSGPKIRTGPIEGGRSITLKNGDPLTIATGDFAGVPGRVSTTFGGLAPSVKAGDRLLLADGLIELRVESTDGTAVQTTVVEGGELGAHKGINAPGVPLAATAVTPKDVADLQFGLSLGVDMVALSFVRSEADLQRTRQLMADAPGVPLIAKLERPEALKRLDAIVRASDAVMVARGDLGLELPLEQVPHAQRDITRRARREGVPVILATQVLESMIAEPRPTRAEVSDAASAVDSGVDAIMLSGETAVGAFPVRAVQTLDAIIREAERMHESDQLAVPESPTHEDHAQALCEAAVTLANRGDAQAIVAVTRGGSTARRLAALRPHAPIFAVTDSPQMARRLILHWGVVPVTFDLDENVDRAWSRIAQELFRRGLVSAGSVVVLVSINPDLSRIDANFLKIHRL
jgi:pyruvate kinase